MIKIFWIKDSKLLGGLYMIIESKRLILRSWEDKRNIDDEKRKILFEISKLYNKRLNGEMSENEYIENYNILNSQRKSLESKLIEIQKNEVLTEEELEFKEKMKKARKIYKNLAIDKFTKEDMVFLIKK